MLQILIVDDDKNIRRYLSVVLSDAGYCVSCADCAQKALDIMEHVRIDLIVLDIMMPGMDGYAFAELLRDCNNDIGPGIWGKTAGASHYHYTSPSGRTQSRSDAPPAGPRRLCNVGLSPLHL